MWALSSKSHSSHIFSLQDLMGDDCNICLETRSEFFHLSCCRHKMCKRCLESLTTPVCPYCRQIIREVQDDQRYRHARSYEMDYLTEQTISTYISSTAIPPEVSELIPPIFIPDSRIMRRQIRRIRRLRQREEDRANNRERSRIYVSRSQRIQELREHVSDSIFAMDEEDGVG